jgi:hypothetical protein
MVDADRHFIGRERRLLHCVIGRHMQGVYPVREVRRRITELGLRSFGEVPRVRTRSFVEAGTGIGGPPFFVSAAGIRGAGLELLHPEAGVVSRDIEAEG